MRVDGIYPNQYTFSAILPCCADTGVIAHGEQIHSLVYKDGFESDLFVRSALVNMYAKCCDMELGMRVFDEVPERNLVSWNSMIVGFSQNKLYDLAVEFFRDVIKESLISPDQVSFSSALSACGNTGRLVFGKQVHGVAVKYGLVGLAYVQNSILDMYSKCGSFDDAVNLFSTMEDRDVNM
ncbi:hypothetical protein IFM89_019526 [Coptis chinensis]|uniref:Pentatricopeptide repeat-containing protein n=1 Tax=Coptis chinensis TaxID=261450 RepID=A0A835LWC4_9MAGN|nr:hypothetical protein IFM89_019526 [Coptis chinensis]